MKKMIMFFTMLINITFLMACVSDNANAFDKSNKQKLTLEMKLDKNYDEQDPSIDERLFCVSEDMDDLIVNGTIELNGKSGILEVKDNKTKEILWSERWKEDKKIESFSILLENLKKSKEYVISFTGTKIDHVTINITFDSDLVQEREKPL